MTEQNIEVGYPGNEINSEFYNIGKKAGTDKIYLHHYYHYYPKFIEYYKNFKDLAMIEIGVFKKESIYLWLEYYPESFIYGFDINISDDGDDKYKIIKCDQSNINDLKNIKNEISKPIFLILDDGSHVPDHQILTFEYLFEILLPGGTYIIEDIETSYWKNANIYGYDVNYGYKNPNSTIEFFKLLVDDINSQFINEDNKVIQNNLIYDRISEKTRKNISTITFTYNTIIVTKKLSQELENRKTPYRFNQKI
jgi:hypothetical protein